MHSIIQHFHVLDNFANGKETCICSHTSKGSFITKLGSDLKYREYKDSDIYNKENIHFRALRLCLFDIHYYQGAVPQYDHG